MPTSGRSHADGGLSAVGLKERYIQLRVGVISQLLEHTRQATDNRLIQCHGERTIQSHLLREDLSHERMYDDTVIHTNPIQFRRVEDHLVNKSKSNEARQQF
jgi:hypothetical protein